MKKLPFNIIGRVTSAHDAAIVTEGEDLQEALREAVLQHISTDTEITVGGITMHLAGWLDPDHWSDDWAKKHISPDDVYELLYATVEVEDV